MEEKNILVVVNKDGSALGPSETFLHAHIQRLPCKVHALIGNPGYRKNYSSNSFLRSRALIPLGLRWLRRRVWDETVAEQDTKALVNFIKDHEIDAVLAEYGSTAATVMRACVQGKTPLIAHFHGWDAYSNYMVNTYKEKYRELFGMASAVVAVSSHMRRRLIEMGSPAIKTFHNACGADIPHGARACPGKAGKRYVMVGRLAEKKTPITSIDAFAKVHQNFPDATLDIIGDGPLKDLIIKRINDLNLQNVVILHGAKSHDYVIDTLKRARCFIQHSVRAEDGDHEGTPVGVLEAMLMGLPVVATKHGGILDVIEDGVTGELVEEHDMETMALKMMKFSENPGLAAKIGEQARQRAMDKYTVDKSIENLWNIIRNCIET